MTTKQQQIKDIETRWDRLVEQRQEHYRLVMSEVEPLFQAALIQELNKSVDYEQAFDAMEEELRKLDPTNFYLAENQVNIF